MFNLRATCPKSVESNLRKIFHCHCVALSINFRTCSPASLKKVKAHQTGEVIILIGVEDADGLRVHCKPIVAQAEQIGS